MPDTEVSDAKRILLCTGKIGHELRAERKKRKDTSTAIVFLDQLYPFPETELDAAIRAPSPDAREIVWVQEEPANMGALFYVLPRLRRIAGDRSVLSVKRSASASPATGRQGPRSRTENPADSGLDHSKGRRPGLPAERSSAVLRCRVVPGNSTSLYAECIMLIFPIELHASARSRTPLLHVAIDTGGTFTDCVWIERGRSAC